MRPADQSERLSRIATRWSLVQLAHSKSGQTAIPARAELAQRYLGAVYRYLLGAVRDENEADELCQEFFVKLLEGKLQGARPEKGRFRDYLKATLVNLINDYHRRRTRTPLPLSEEVAKSGSNDSLAEGDDFLAIWREELLERTWQALREQRPVYHAVLKLRVDLPEHTSRQLADTYEQQQDRPMSPAAVRKTLERAHGKFADLLVLEVARSLEQPDRQAMQAELAALDLLKYCGSAVERWTARQQPADLS